MQQFNPDFEVETLFSPIAGTSNRTHQTTKFDDKLAKATLQVLETGRLTPLIKEELKCKIQARRHSLGQSDMQVEFKKPRTYSLTPDEIEKVHNRKEKNKMAARRFRAKRKAETMNTEDEVSVLEKRNKELLDQFYNLKVEKQQLLAALSQIPSKPEVPFK